MSLLNTVSGMMSSGMINKVASLVGIESGLAKTALNAVMPNILKGITSTGATESGASSLLSMIKNNGLGDNLNFNDDLIKSGGKLNDSLFGSKLSDINVPGLSGDKRTSLMNLATPMALGSIGKIAHEKNLDAKGLSAYLRDNAGTATTTLHKATETTKTATSDASTSGGSGIFKWLLPLLILLGLGYFWMSRDKTATAEVEDTTMTSTSSTTSSTSNSANNTATTSTSTNGTINEGQASNSTADTRDGVDGAAELKRDAAGNIISNTDGSAVNTPGVATNAKGLSLDDDGNLLKDGKLFLEKGEFTEKDGEYFDKEGKSLGFLAKLGKALGDAGKAVGGAVAGAADKTADFFKNSFGSMFKKKKGGEAVAAYSLNKIVFDDDSHMIKSFSKNEVEGLAAALKADPNAKITVQATGGSKKLSGNKAQVIHDMLVTLGVDDGQIKAKGMGDGDEKFEIVID